jgi:predicted nucleic acid-binding protein
VIVLDASVLIAHLDEHDADHERAAELLAGSGTEPLGASTVSLAETFVAPARARRLSEATTALERLGIQELPLSTEASARLAQLRAATDRQLPDCCVLLAAQEHGGTVASFDVALVDAAGGIGLATLT